MIALKKKGLTKAIGLSNVSKDAVEFIVENSDEIPSSVQVEFHPLIAPLQKELKDCCESKGIVVTAYSPLGNNRQNLPRIIDLDNVKALAAKNNRTEAQLCINWCVSNGVCCIPKSVTPHRLQSNLESLNFDLTDEERKTLNVLPNTLGTKRFNIPIQYPAPNGPWLIDLFNTEHESCAIWKAPEQRLGRRGLRLCLTGISEMLELGMDNETDSKERNAMGSCHAAGKIPDNELASNGTLSRTGLLMSLMRVLQQLLRHRCGSELMNELEREGASDAEERSGHDDDTTLEKARLVLVREHAKVARTSLEHGDDEHVADDGTAHGYGDVPEALVGGASVPGVEYRHDESKEVRRCGEEQRVGPVVAERLDDGGEEVGVRLSHEEHVLHQDAKPNNGILESEGDAGGPLLGLLILSGTSVLGADTVDGEVLHVALQPASVAGPVRKQSCGHEGDADGGSTLDDEDVAPCTEAVRAVQVLQDTSGKETAEAIGQRVSTVEDGDTGDQLRLFVEAREEIDNTAEEGSLEETKRDSACHQTAVVVRGTRTGADDTPQGHAARQGGLVLVRVETEVLGEGAELCVCKTVAVDDVEEEHDDDDRHDMKIELANQMLFEELDLVGRHALERVRHTALVESLIGLERGNTRETDLLVAERVRDLGRRSCHDGVALAAVGGLEHQVRELVHLAGRQLRRRCGLEGSASEGDESLKKGSCLPAETPRRMGGRNEVVRADACR
ncbi:hypothetical protein L1887_56582 [Cichorium endivia]|nr:hypothetical protein L1887_56582 [Cichorium endivia]